MSLPRLSRACSVQLALLTAITLAVGLLALVLYLPASAQSAPPQDQSDRTVFTQADGLAADSVTALLGDSKGLWIGTLEGLNHYETRGADAGLVWETLTQADGLAADAVTHLWTDSSDGLWVAHPDGQISFFDGESWTIYADADEALTQAYKYIVNTDAEGPLWAIDAGGRVWMLADDTVGYYVGAVWRPYGEDAAIPPGELVAVWSAGRGAWVASETGQVGYFDGANWTTFRNAFDAVQRQYETILGAGPKAGPLWLVDQDGTVWVRNAFNQRDVRPDVRRFAEGRWTNFGSGDGMATGFVEELRLDRYGRVWARHAAGEDGQGGGLSLYVGGEDAARLWQDATGAAPTTPWVAFEPVLSGNVTDFEPDGTTGVWIGSHSPALGNAGGVPVGGLTHISFDTWQRISLESLDGAAIGGSWVDQNQELWLGLASDPRSGLEGGVWRYRPTQPAAPGRWVRVTGLLDGDVRDLWGDGQGNIWVATASGVNRIAIQSRGLFSYTLPLAPDRIAGDAAGGLWAVALGETGGVWRWNGHLWARQNPRPGSDGVVYNDVLTVDDGRVFLAGDSGLDIWQDGRWERFSALPGRHVKRMWQDSAGDLWLSSEITPGRPFNLSLNQGQRWEAVLTEKDTSTMGAEVLALLRDRGGRVWLGTSAGLFAYESGDQTKWHSLGPVEGLDAGPATALYEDDAGTLWVAVGARAFRTDLLLCAPPDVCTDWHSFEPGVGVLSRIAAGPEGSVLFLGDAGVALYQPRPPQLRLDGVVNPITQEAFDGQAPVVLTAGRNALRVDLTTLAATLPANDLAYRYRLAGVDPGWRLLTANAAQGKQVSISYAGLAGGVYTFTAAARAGTLDYSPAITFALYVLSQPPSVFLQNVTVGERPVAYSEPWQAFIEQPIWVEMRGSDDQGGRVAYRYRVEGANQGWTETNQSEISFTLSAAGTYTFSVVAVDGEGQVSEVAGAPIIVREREVASSARRLPMQAIAIGMGLIGVLFIGSAVVLMVRRRQRESW
jgi:hypothetical protein